ncbi:MAG TPA: D-Ala-D-Ala carboxypeptidase family metallohydrolase [Planctomycetota bacterium]|jgi:hypothetical protein
MIRRTPWDSTKRNKLLGFVLLIGALVVGAATISFFCRRSKSPQVVPVAEVPACSPAVATGWRVEVAGDSSRSQHFSGHYAAGQVLFVPAGATFLVTPEPPNCQGMLCEKSLDGKFDHDGGELNIPTEKNGHLIQECRAPFHPGLYPLVWKTAQTLVPAAMSASTSGGAATPAVTLNLMVLSRAEAQTKGDRTSVKVNGSSIGAYHDPAQSSVRRVRENAHLYKPPEFFAVLTPDTIPLSIGPDFDLGQLVAFKDYHGPDGKKVYTTIRHTDVLPPRPELIDKLNKLRDRLRSKGVKVTKFWITSGFRTPEYNHSIGGAAYSRHCFGDAVDLVIDEDDDKKMDDLNGDGRIDRKDGIIIGNACRELELEGAVVPGGIGVYEWQADDSVGSHVHIDCRGYISRWGQIGSGRTKKTFVWWPKAEFQEEDSGE